MSVCYCKGINSTHENLRTAIRERVIRITLSRDDRHDAAAGRTGTCLKKAFSLINSSNMKKIIIYYSFTQNNEKLALYLKKLLNCDIVKIETVKKRSSLSILFDLMFARKPTLKPVPYYLRDYDHIIFVAPIWAGKIAMPLKSFLTAEKENIKRFSFITVCGGSAGQKEKIMHELTTTLGKTPAKIVELWINNLLPPEKKNTIKSTSEYRIEIDELAQFDSQLKDFVQDPRPV